MWSVKNPKYSRSAAGWKLMQDAVARALRRAADRRTRELDTFTKLSLEMLEHTQGQNFEAAMRTFPSEKFHAWGFAGQGLLATLRGKRKGA